MNDRYAVANRQSRSKLGYTLVEILSVVAILIVLFAILRPAIASARNRSGKTRTLSDLHQLGIAANMYHDSNGLWPLSTPPLVKSGLVPIELVASPRDTSLKGQANDLADRFRKESPYLRAEATSYKRSYLGPWDNALDYSEFQKRIEEQPTAGWLVDLVGMDAVNGPSPFLSRPEKGRYQRLTLEGAVVTRPYARVTIVPGSETFLPEMLFADGDMKWLKSMYP